MAEARSEEEEENMMRDTREQVVRRQPNSSGGRPDRRKPEHRHSQGPLSSIRAAIKRTSTRSTSLSETSRDRDRERDRDRDRDRRRPEITILSAEPLASTSWFPGASAGFPPPPPPAAQIWGPTIPPSIQPPPSYEEVIREKTQEQVLLPSSSPGSSSSSRPVSTITIATQTDPGSAPEPPDPEVKRPVRPPRPRLPHPPKSSHVNDITTTSQSALASLNSNSVVPNTHPGTHASTHTQCCDVLADLCSPLTLTTSAQTDQSDQPCAAVAVAAPPTTSSSSHVQLERPRPRPRSKLFAQPIGNEVKVQTLVKLREDGLATLAARARAEPANQEVSQGKYLQELLEAFSSDDWGFPERRSDSSGHSQSESEDGDEEEEEEDMATLKARIQAFEQQQQQVADGSCGDSNFVTKRPEPRPRPRLQGQPAKSAPPVVAPKPKNFSHTPKPSSKVFWEEGGLAAAASDSGGTEALKTAESPPADLNPKPPPATEPAPSCAPKSAPVLTPQPFKTTEKPPVTPKPQCSTETPTSSNPAPVPAPRPPPPKLTPSLSDASSTAKPPPRPPVAPRASMGAPPQDKSPTAGRTTPTLPPRPSAEVGGGAQTETQTGGAETQDTANQSVKAGSVRPGIPTKPAALTSPRRASAPSLAPKPTVTSPTPPDPNPVPTKPAAAPATTPKPSGPTAPVPAKPPTPAPTPATTPAPAPAAAPTSALAPAPAPTPAPAPAPALRKGPAIPTKPETTSTANPNSSDPPLPPRPSGVKFLPLRPPPMKSIPGRPPPPAVNSSTSSANQIPPPSKTSPAPSVSPASQSSPSQTAPPPSSVTANQLQAQRAPKRGPPLPPRPKPGHPLYSSYTKQEVLIVLDDPSPAPSEHLSGEGKSQTTIAPLINPSQCLLDLDTQPEPVPDQDSQSKPALENLGLSESQSILPVQPEQKEQPDPPPVSGPRCTALFDYEGEEEDELTFSQGDVIALLEVIGQEWGRGQIHGRIGIFPLNFVEVVEPLPQPVSSPGETTKTTSADTTVIESTAAPKTSQDPNSEAEEWAVALFDFPGQTAEDLSFHKGALIRVTEHFDAEWRRGRLEGREGLYPAAFTLPHQAESVPVQQSAVKGVAKALFEFTAESEDELSLKVGDIITQVESVDEQWILGAVGGKRGIVPKNYISLL